jgi:hypothetical protein
MFLFQILSDDLVERIRRWHELKRWERREIGQTLRRMGLSYREISAVLPVTKGTLSGWCRDIPLRDERRGELLGKRGGREHVGALLRQRNNERTCAIRAEAREEVELLGADPAWVAGVLAYWSEGTKRGNELCFANSDPALVRLFIEWAREHLSLEPERFTVRLHFHSGQDEAQLRAFWATQLALPEAQFRKGYVKREGSGHRKNILYNGTAQVRVRRSSDLRHRVLGWIDGVAERFGALKYTSAGR